MMDLIAVRKRLIHVAEASDWPDFIEAWTAATSRERPDWQLPILAHRSVNGQAIDETSLFATVGAIQLSIILIDNMLDGDPGPHDRIGFAAASNLATAFQAAAFLCSQTITYEVVATALITNLLATAVMRTAVGQVLDISVPLGTEDDYWRVVRSKSSPYYGATLALGAAAGGATMEQVTILRRLGDLVGEAVQVTDDLVDALATPANPDWLMMRQNLVILYGRLADHARRDELLQLMAGEMDDTRLETVQQILLDSGAADYCQHVLQAKRSQMEALIETGHFPNPSPLHELVERVTRLTLD